MPIDSCIKRIAQELNMYRRSLGSLSADAAQWIRAAAAIPGAVLLALVFGNAALAADLEQGSREGISNSMRVAELNTVALSRGGVTVALGDKLRITFFEKIEAQNAHPEQSPPINVVERVELTGDYTVQEDGNLFLPFVGQISAVGQNLGELKAHLLGAFEQVFGRSGHVTIVFIEREPIYIVGPVARPGTYKYSPRMTVLHAVALSGGFENSTADVYQFLEAIREKEKLRKATERLKSLLARKTVLRAERTGEKPELPPRLIEFAGRSEAEALVAEVASLRTLTRERREAQLSALDATIKYGKQELQSLRSRIAQIQSNIGTKSERLKAVSSMLERGITGGHNIFVARGDLSDIQERLLDAMITVSHNENRLAQANQEKIKLMTEAQIELERDIFSTEQECVETEIAVDLGNQALKGVTAQTYKIRVASTNAMYHVTRRTAAGVQVFAAREAFLLEPGDLISIEGRIETGSLNLN